MRTALFTKLFGNAGVDVVESTAAELGFDGVDLLIRDGFPAAPSDPASVREHLAHLSRTSTPVLTAGSVMLMLGSGFWHCSSLVAQRHRSTAQDMPAA